MYDPELYRTKDEVAQWKQRDPIPAFMARLREWGLLSEPDLAQMEREIDGEIQAAVRTAENGEWEPASDLLKDVQALAIG